MVGFVTTFEGSGDGGIVGGVDIGGFGFMVKVVPGLTTGVETIATLVEIGLARMTVEVC